MDLTTLGILDLSSYSWKTCKYDDSYRSKHTGSLGINNNIIVIGYEDNIIMYDELGPYQPKMTPMNNVMLEPKSLKQLAIKTVCEYQGQLPWECLPQKIIDLMRFGHKDDIATHCAPVVFRGNCLQRNPLIEVVC